MELKNSGLEVRNYTPRTLQNYMCPHWNNLSAKVNILYNAFHIFVVWNEAHILLIEVNKSILKIHVLYLGAR